MCVLATSEYTCSARAREPSSEGAQPFDEQWQQRRGKRFSRFRHCPKGEGTPRQGDETLKKNDRRNGTAYRNSEADAGHARRKHQETDGHVTVKE